MVTHVHHYSAFKLRQKDHKFEASMGYQRENKTKIQNQKEGKTSQLWLSEAMWEREISTGAQNM